MNFCFQFLSSSSCQITLFLSAPHCFLEPKAKLISYLFPSCGIRCWEVSKYPARETQCSRHGRVTVPVLSAKPSNYLFLSLLAFLFLDFHSCFDAIPQYWSCSAFLAIIFVAGLYSIGGIHPYFLLSHWGTLRFVPSGGSTKPLC